MSLMTLPRRSIWPAPSRRSIWPGRYGAGSGVAVDPLTISEFYAPLTHSLTLTRGTGSATYTRATTAWEFDNESKLVPVPSGIPRFGGARFNGTDTWYNTDSGGSPISAASLLGYHSEGARTNSLLYSRDLTNAAWAKTNVTATKSPGIDGAATSGSTLTAGADNATILQTLTLASAARSSSAYVKRRTGTGTISFTRNGGSNWTDITSLINSSTWTRVKIENTSVTNPSVGFLIATSGDSIDVDVVQDEAGAFSSSPIVTTTAAVTRNVDLLSYATAGNASNTVGTCLATARTYSAVRTSGAGVPMVDAYSGAGTGAPLCIRAAVTGYLSIYDGTSHKYGSIAVGDSAYSGKFSSSWNATVGAVAKDGTLSATAALDGNLNLGTALGIGQEPGTVGNLFGYIKETHIWQSPLTDEQLVTVTTP